MHTPDNDRISAVYVVRDTTHCQSNGHAPFYKIHEGRNDRHPRLHMFFYLVVHISRSCIARPINSRGIRNPSFFVFEVGSGPGDRAQWLAQNNEWLCGIDSRDFHFGC